jgi:hypothetical protein
MPQEATESDTVRAPCPCQPERYTLTDQPTPGRRPGHPDVSGRFGTSAQVVSPLTAPEGLGSAFEARAIRCAQAIVESTAQVGVQLRVGSHTGECEVKGDDRGGLAVQSLLGWGRPASGEVLVSGDDRGTRCRIRHRVQRALRTRTQRCAGSWKLFAVEGYETRRVVPILVGLRPSEPTTDTATFSDGYDDRHLSWRRVRQGLVYPG